MDTVKKPRNFHLNDEVIWENDDGFVEGPVITERFDFLVIGMKSEICIGHKSQCCHASDGAPLGKFVPLVLPDWLNEANSGTLWAWGHAYKTANAIIKGKT